VIEETDRQAIRQVQRFDRPLVGIGYKSASAACFVIMGGSVKAASDIPLGEAVFFRSAISLIILVLLMHFRGELRDRCNTRHPMAHIGRGLIGVAGLSFAFAAFTRLPITEVTTLLYAVPIVLVAVGAFAFKEQVGINQWLAVVAGIVGVVIVAWPRLSMFSAGSGFNASYAVGLMCAFGAICSSAAASVAIRKLVATERSSCLVLSFSLVCAISSLMTLPFGWVLPSAGETILLMSAGIAGAFGQIALSEAYRNANMSIVAPFEYVSLVIAILVGIYLFDEWPTLHTMVGGAVVILSTAYLVLRERRAKTG
jgi:drug/metabolite transporter (DMT)-like permease